MEEVVGLVSDPEPTPLIVTPAQLLADWDAGKTVRLYVGRGPGFESHPNVLLAAKVQMESLRIVLGYKPAGSAKSKWNGLTPANWTAHVNQAVTAAGAQGLASIDAENAANIGGQYFEQGVDVLQAGFTLGVSKTGVVVP